MAFIWGQFHKRYLSHYSLKLAWKLPKIKLKSLRCQWVNCSDLTRLRVIHSSSLVMAARTYSMNDPTTHRSLNSWLVIDWKEWSHSQSWGSGHLWNPILGTSSVTSTNFQPFRSRFHLYQALDFPSLVLTLATRWLWWGWEWGHSLWGHPRRGHPRGWRSPRGNTRRRGHPWWHLIGLTCGWKYGGVNSLWPSDAIMMA